MSIATDLRMVAEELPKTYSEKHARRVSPFICDTISRVLSQSRAIAAKNFLGSLGMDCGQMHLFGQMPGMYGDAYAEAQECRYAWLMFAADIAQERSRHGRAF